MSDCAVRQIELGHRLLSPLALSLLRDPLLLPPQPDNDLTEEEDIDFYSNPTEEIETDEEDETFELVNDTPQSFP